MNSFGIEPPRDLVLEDVAGARLARDRDESSRGRTGRGRRSAWRTSSRHAFPPLRRQTGPDGPPGLSLDRRHQLEPSGHSTMSRSACTSWRSGSLQPEVLHREADRIHPRVAAGAGRVGAMLLIASRIDSGLPGSLPGLQRRHVRGRWRRRRQAGSRAPTCRAAPATCGWIRSDRQHAALAEQAAARAVRREGTRRKWLPYMFGMP